MEHGQIVETGLPHQILPRVSSEAFFEEPKETPSTPPKYKLVCKNGSETYCIRNFSFKWLTE